MKHMLAIVSAFAASVAFADPQTYYVDERGSDDYDGKASYADIDTSVSPVKGPKKTRKAAAALVTATSSADEVGDTIYIYPGDYRNTESSPAFCAVLPAGCRLIGVGDKSAIRIHGSGMNWEDRASCILFGDGAGAMLLEATQTDNDGIIATKLYANGEDEKYNSIISSFSSSKLAKYPFNKISSF